MRSLHAFLSKVFKKISYSLNKYTNFDETTFVSLKPKGTPNGSALISYVAEPFLLQSGTPIPNSHTHFWESLEMADAFLRCGYAVDVISYRSNSFVPQKEYTFFIGSRVNFDRIAGLLNGDCIKIAHMDMSHWLFNNSAAIKRCLQLQQRKGITLKSYKLQEENWAVEHADYITILGNKFTEDTYTYAGKPIFRLPIPSCVTFPKPVNKDYDACKKNFLWFGSRGVIHKGLDLVIEAFLDLPDHHLTICGPVNKDKDIKFAKMFHKELYETSNIHTVGWVDVESSTFSEIMNNCIGIIFPSAAEGGGGCVVTTMHGGLIPIVSYEASVDIDDSFGILLKENTIEEIKREVLNLSGQSASALCSMSQEAWQQARDRYTREQYSIKFEKMIRDITAEKVKNASYQLKSN